MDLLGRLLVEGEKALLVLFVLVGGHDQAYHVQAGGSRLSASLYRMPGAADSTDGVRASLARHARFDLNFPTACIFEEREWTQ